METSEDLFVFGDDGRATYSGQTGVINLQIKDGEIHINQNSESDKTIVIPVSVVSKLILDFDKNNIRSQLKAYLEK